MAYPLKLNSSVGGATAGWSLVAGHTLVFESSYGLQLRLEADGARLSVMSLCCGSFYVVVGQQQFRCSSCQQLFTSLTAGPFMMGVGGKYDFDALMILLSSCLDHLLPSLDAVIEASLIAESFELARQYFNLATLTVGAPDWSTLMEAQG